MTAPPQTQLETNASTAGPSTRLAFGMALMLVAIVGFSHVESFTVPFQFDDSRNIEQSVRVLESAKRGQVRAFLASSRPFGLLTLGLNYRWGGFDVWGYHLINFLVHLACSGLVFWLSNWAIEQSGVGILRDSSVRLWVAWGIALLWGTHPLASQPVIYIVQRLELLSALFTLLSISAFSLIAQGKRWPLTVLACSAWLGVLSKEPAAMLPILILLWDRTFCGKLWQTRKHWTRLAAYLLAITPWLWFFPRFFHSVLPNEHANATSTTGPSVGFDMRLLTWWDYLRTQPEVLLQYLKCSIWPSDLCFDYGWKVQANPGIYWPLLTLFAITFIYGCFLWWRRSIWGFLVLAFFVYLAPSSSIIPIADLAVEHRMYLPLAFVISAGVIALCKICLESTGRLGSSLPEGIRKAFLIVALIGTCFTLIQWTRQRVNAYQSPILLWQDTLTKRPDNARAYHNLGVSYLVDYKDPQSALPHLQRSLELWPVHARWWFNLGECQRQLAMHDKAVISINNAIERDPGFKEAYNCLGICLQSQDQLELAEQAFGRAIELGEETARYNLASLYLTQQSPAKALQQLERLAESRPDFKNTYRRIAWILATTADDTLRDGRKAVRLLEQTYIIENSQNPYAWDAYAAALAEEGQFQQAAEAAERAINLADAAGNQNFVTAIKVRMAGYRNNQPYRDKGLDQDGVAQDGVDSSGSAGDI